MSTAAYLVAATPPRLAVGGIWNSAQPARLRPELTMGVGFAATGVVTVLAAADFGTPWTIAAYPKGAPAIDVPARPASGLR